MNVLMISLDSNLLAQTNKMGDVRERHINYARLLDQMRPGSTLHILVRTKIGENDVPVKLATNVWGYAVGTHPLFFYVNATSKARKIAQQFPLALITTQTPFLDGLIGCWLKSILQKPLLVQLHISQPGDQAWLTESVSNGVRTVIARWVIRRANGIRVNTERIGNWLTENWGVKQAKIYVNPVSPIQLVADPDTSKSDKPTVLYVGRLSPEKGVDVLLRAFAQIIMILPKARLLIVGDGPETESLQALAKDLDLVKDKNIMFIGSVVPESLPQYYQEAWIVALPSRHESYGRVILEAFAMARPVVATDTEGAKTLISEAEDGLIVPGEDPFKLGQQLIYLLTQPDIAVEMGKRGQAKAAQMDNVEQVRQNLINIWLKIAES